MVMMPQTAELLDLTAAPTDQIADWRMRTIEIRHQLEALASDLNQELARRIDFESANRTVRVGGFELTVQAPTETEWDLGRLGIALEALVADGRIARPVADKAIEKKVTYKPVPAHLKKLLAHADPEVRESIARCQSTVENKRRRVEVRLVHD